MAMLDTVGRADAVMLDEISEKAFIENLKLRYDADKMYSYIGEVLVAVNPFKPLGIYGVKEVSSYRGAALYQREPHVFAIAEASYTTMLRNEADCCVIISGESGSGKTESSKQIIEFIASCVSTEKSKASVEKTKALLLASNPLLEAFGNAATARNDNSSRFGKYMDINFDYKFEPAGGNIRNYLLEKARVVRHAPTDRNFHIFHQLLAGADNGLLQNLGLERDTESYAYLAKSAKPAIADKNGFAAVEAAIKAIGFAEETRDTLFNLVAATLLLGQVVFEPNGEHCKFKDAAAATAVAARLGTDVAALEKALTFRVVAARGEVTYSELTAERATYGRDALAKALYNELFSYLVRQINGAIAVADGGESAKGYVIGVLDIYGFEIFPTNGFEQFCINYCNEKLQQLFIELVMKREQAEYAAEGITWVDVPFFDNAKICDLVENPKNGIITILDEQCNRPNGSDDAFFAHMEKALQSNERYQSHSKDPKSGCKRDLDFKILHFAGDVIYTSTDFVDKNNDTLFQDLKRMLYECKTPALKEMFPEGADELTAVHKNPTTAATNFKMSMADLTELLASKEPFYVRCIKPNGDKAPDSFDESLVDHQVRYLGLMENLRVRRAGYCNRQPYEQFVQRYKMLSPHTWPVWRKDMKEGTKILIDTLGFTDKDVAFGKTKLFIKEPSTLYFIEEKREEAIPMLVAKIQAAYRGLLARRFVKKLRAYTKICRWYRKIKSTSYFSKLESAFKGVADRPDFGKGVVWPKPIPGAGPFDELAHRIHTRWWVSSVLKKYEPLRAEIELKLPAYNIMKGRRSEWGVGVPWLGNYCAKSDDRDKFGPGITSLFEKFGDNKVEFSSRVSLLNKKGKQEERALVVSNKHLYVLDVKKWKSVDKKPTPIDDVEGITVSTGEDQLVVIAVPGGTDLVVKLQGQALSAELVCAILRGCAENIAVAVTDEIKVTLKGKESTLSFEVADANKSEFKASKAGVRLVTRKQSVMLMRERLSSNASP